MRSRDVEECQCALPQKLVGQRVTLENQIRGCRRRWRLARLSPTSRARPKPKRVKDEPELEAKDKDLTGLRVHLGPYHSDVWLPSIDPDAPVQAARQHTVQLGVDKIGDAMRPVLNISEQPASRLELRIIQTTRQSVVDCGIAGYHRLHFAPSDRYRQSRRHERFEGRLRAESAPSRINSRRTGVRSRAAIPSQGRNTLHRPMRTF